MHLRGATDCIEVALHHCVRCHVSCLLDPVSYSDQRIISAALASTALQFNHSVTAVAKQSRAADVPEQV